MDKYTQARILLNEALDHITEKYWDDHTQLYRRICKFLGKPYIYEDSLKEIENN